MPTGRIMYKTADAGQCGELPRRQRVVIDLDARDRGELRRRAYERGMTVSNYIRQCCDLTLERQGVKREDRG